MQDSDHIPNGLFDDIFFVVSRNVNCYLLTCIGLYTITDPGFSGRSRRLAYNIKDIKDDVFLYSNIALINILLPPSIAYSHENIDLYFYLHNAQM